MKKLSTTLFIFIMCIANVFAITEGQKISLKEAIEYASRTNPQIQIRKLDSEISKNEIKKANRLQNPSLITFQNIGKTRFGNPQQIGARYNIELFKRYKRKKLAESNYKITINSENISKFDLILEIKKAYIDFLLKKSILKIVRQEENLARQLYETAKNNKVSEPDLIEAKIALNRSIMRTNTAKTKVIFAQNHFNTILNSSDINFDTKEDGLTDNYSSLLTIKPEDNNLEFEKIKNYALEHRSDIIQAYQRVLSAQKNLSVIKSNLIPNLEVEGGWGYETANNSDTGNFTSGAYLSASLTDIPILYRYKPEIHNAQLEIEKAKLNYEDIKIDAIRNITDAWEKYTIARDNLIFYNKRLLKDSQSLLNASQKSLDKKENDITSYLVAKKLYFELLMGYQEALAQYYISYGELCRETNITQENL